MAKNALNITLKDQLSHCMNEARLADIVSVRMAVQVCPLLIVFEKGDD